MKRGLLLYDGEGIARNRWFADRLREEAEAVGLTLTTAVLAPGERPALSGESFAVVRVIDPGLTAYLEAAGLRVFNNAATSRVANSKWETYRLAKALGIPVLETHRLTERQEPPFYPAVIKSFDGHGGKEVFLVRDADAYRALPECLQGRDRIAQPLCSQPGVDMRVYVMGDRVMAGMVRRSETDFRSNFSLGGQVTVGEVTASQREVVAALYEVLHWDFVGVDFIRHEGEWVLNEIEDVVGTRMLYRVAERDAAREYMQYIVKLL